MIPTYSRVLSSIKKALWEIVEEYHRVRKSLRNLVKGQERNIAQLKRIRAVMKWRWGLEEESEDNTEGSEDGLRKIQEKGTPSSASC